MQKGQSEVLSHDDADIKCKSVLCEFCVLDGKSVCQAAESAEAVSYEESALHVGITKKKKQKKQVPLELMHRRMGHYNVKYLMDMDKAGSLDVKLIGGTKGFCCEACRKSKATRHNPPKSREGDIKPTKPFQSVFSDLKGKLKPDFWGNQYVITFTCEVTRWTVVRYCSHKSKTIDCFRDFLSWVKVRNWKVCMLTTDGGGEYGAGENCSNLSDFQQLCVDENIVQRYTAANTQGQNGISERLNRTLCDNAAASCDEAVLENRFWSLAVTATCWVRNRITHATLTARDGRLLSPHEKLYGEHAKLKMARVFGCDAWWTTMLIIIIILLHPK